MGRGAATIEALPSETSPALARLQRRLQELGVEEVPPAAQEDWEALRAHHLPTIRHSERVTVLAGALAEELGLSGPQARMIAVAALLHDLGKGQLDVGYIDSAAPLGPEEFEVTKTHAALGADRLAELGFEQRVVEGARSHHERLDGSGYPDGLCGAEIPFVARLLAVCDVWEAITSSSRRYTGFENKLAAYEKARALLQAGRGTQFEARMVDALLERIDRDDPLAGLAEADPIATAA